MNSIPIITTPRGLGYTTWLIKAAVKNPKVIIVFGSDNAMNSIKPILAQELEKANLSEEGYREFHKDLVLITMKMMKEVLLPDRPIIYDNSCFTSPGVLFTS